MTLALDQLFALGILSASAHWLIARSEIARPIWSRATGKLDALLRCAGCSGWWLGLGFGAAGIRPVKIEMVSPVMTILATMIVTGLLAVFVTPILEALLLWGLHNSAVQEESGMAADGDPTPVDPVVGTRETRGDE